MINADMRPYDFYLFEDENAYGQPTISAEIKGSVKLALYVVNQSITDNALYSGAEFIGLTAADITDKHIIKLDNEVRLKVRYVQPKGRLKQVYLQRM